MSLEVKNLSFSYKCWNVLNNINFKAEQGNLICVLGKNGAGKSTLFRCILGLLPHFKGEVLANEKNIKELKAEELAQKIAYIPQVRSSAFSYSVLDMVLMGTTAQVKRFSSPGKKQYKIAVEALERMNISNLADRNYMHISGGEQQLVLVARVIAQQAKIIIMDEPCSNLDYGNQIKLMQEVKKLSREGYLIIQSTHNPEQALLFADKVMILHNGKIDRFGNPNEVIDEALLYKIYGIHVQLHDITQSGIRVCVPETGTRYHPIFVDITQKGDKYVGNL